MSEITQNCKYCELNGLSHDTGGHLYINTEKNVYYCQRCGEAGKWDGALPSVYKVKRNTFKNLELFKFDIKGNHPIANKVFDYIIKRLPLEVVMAKCRWSPTIERAFFPVWVNNKVVMWQGRAINKDVKPKYLTWGPCSRYLYGFEEAKDWAVLVEGPLDALSCPNGVALFGKNISDIQFALLTSKFSKVYWCLDTDTRGQKKIEEQKEWLREWIEIIDIKLPEGKDPNDLGKEKMNDLIRIAERST